MLEYVVKLSGNAEFCFDDSHTAMTFAQLAVNKRVGDLADVIMIIRKEKEIEDETD